MDRITISKNRSIFPLTHAGASPCKHWALRIICCVRCNAPGIQTVDMPRADAGGQVRSRRVTS